MSTKQFALTTFFAVLLTLLLIGCGEFRNGGGLISNNPTPERAPYCEFRDPDTGVWRFGPCRDLKGYQWERRV